MKHMFVSIGFPPEQGGIQESVYFLARNMRGQVTVFARATPSHVEFDARQGFEVKRFGTSGIKNLVLRGLGKLSPFAPFQALYRKNLKKWIAENKPDIIHCMHINTAIVGQMAKKDFGTPYFLYCFGKEITPPYLTENKVFATPIKPLFEEADAIYCASDFVRGFVTPLVSRQDKAKTIPIGGPDASFYCPRNSKTEKYLLTAGDMTNANGIFTCLEALKTLRDNAIQAKWIFIGQGPKLTEAKKFAQQKGVEKHVEFITSYSLEQLRNLYQQCYAAVLLSNTCLSPECGEINVEGSGTSLLRASACGKPIIGANSGALREIIQDGVNGFLIDRGTKELGEKLLELFKNPKTAMQLGENGRKTIARHSIQRAANIIEQDAELLSRTA